MERVLELDREGIQAGNLTGSMRFFGGSFEITKPTFLGFFFLHATLMEHFSLFYQFESSVRCAYSVFWLLEQACEFTLSQHGPFTAFIPVGQNPFQVG